MKGPRDFNQRTESATESSLMAAVRGRRIAPEDLESAVPDFPLKLQIQTSSPCNAACVMCPWPETAGELPQGLMEQSTFDRLVDEIAEQRVERVSLFLMNEPLLDKRLADWTARLKTSAPRTITSIFTNGALLDAARARSLGSAGLDELTVSVLGFDAESYERNMKGLDFDRMVRQLVEVGELYRGGELGSMRLSIVGLDLADSNEGVANFEGRTGLEVSINRMTNRAGNVEAETLESLGPSPVRLPTFRACQRPFVKAYVLYNGDVCLCNCDWRRTTILGSLDRQSLAEIWRGKALTRIRREHFDRALSAGSLCAGCDYPYLDA